MSVDNPFSAMMSGLCGALDECIATMAEGDPRRAAAALADLGFTKTAALLGVGTPPTGVDPWRRLDEAAGYSTRRPPRGGLS